MSQVCLLHACNLFILYLISMAACSVVAPAVTVAASSRSTPVVLAELTTALFHESLFFGTGVKWMRCMYVLCWEQWFI